MTEPIRVVVSGASGRMGKEIRQAVRRDSDLALVGAIDIVRPQDDADLPWADDPARLFARVQARVLIDFSIASASPAIVRAALEAGVSPVVGTSGLPASVVEEIASESRRRGVGAAIVPNFALGAVLMMHFATIGARFFDAAEIVEGHHDTKIDAPSGTAVATAQAMAAARGSAFHHNVPEKENLAGGRGAELGGIAIHSVRLPGLVARQEVVFGALGQTLKITHDTTSRESFMPGIMMAVKAIANRSDFVYGLGPLLGLE